MQVDILELISGAEQARGTAVIIDVFRAFTLEPVILDRGAAELIATGDEAAARRRKDQDPSWILAGERHGRKLEGFDYGNSPSEALQVSFENKHVVHTTSAGTQGLAGAVHADLLFAASLVNAKATAQVIAQLRPDQVSLVCMGWEGRRNTEEDLLCARYIKALLEGETYPGIREDALALKEQEGRKFFDPAQADVFPEADFWVCVDVNRYDFAIQAVPIRDGFAMRKVRP